MQLTLTQLHYPIRPLLKKKGDGFDLGAFGIKEHEIKHIVESMKANEKALRKIKNWTLQQAFLQDWTVSKKPDRDFVKYALAGKLEDVFVRQYRRKLFDDCKSAQWMRCMLLQNLQPFFRISTAHPVFAFLDGYTVGEIAEPEVVVETVRKEKVFTDAYDKDRQTLIGMLTKLEQSSISQEMPWDTGLNKQVSDAIAKLEKVRMSCKMNVPDHSEQKT